MYMQMPPSAPMMMQQHPGQSKFILGKEDIKQHS
jgi:hypothetical protein